MPWELGPPLELHGGYYLSPVQEAFPGRFVVHTPQLGGGPLRIIEMDYRYLGNF